MQDGAVNAILDKVQLHGRPLPGTVVGQRDPLGGDAVLGALKYFRLRLLRTAA